MTEEVRQSIFEEKPSSDKGLGMLLIKDFVTKNNGTVTVESEEGRGTTFILTFLKPKSRIIKIIRFRLMKIASCNYMFCLTPLN
jgi:signal transduction histidine kinase